VDSRKILMGAFHKAVADSNAAARRKASKGDKRLKDIPVSEQKRVDRNAQCACGSGKKVKKCCGSTRVRVEDSVVAQAEEFIAVSKGLPQTVVAMLRADTPPAEVYAYYHTGDYISEDNRAVKSAEALAIWDAHMAEFSNCDAALQQKIIADISAVSVTEAT